MPSSKTSSSPRCDAFIAPIRSFDVHCYFDAVGCPQLSSFTFLPHTCRLTTRQKDEKEVRFAEKLRQAIQQEFPELAVYKMHHSPIGPHPLAMFEVDVESPAQFGALIPWLAIRHGPSASCSIRTREMLGRITRSTQLGLGRGSPLTLQYSIGWMK